MHKQFGDPEPVYDRSKPNGGLGPAPVEDGARVLTSPQDITYDPPVANLIAAETVYTVPPHVGATVEVLKGTTVKTYDPAEAINPDFWPQRSRTFPSTETVEMIKKIIETPEMQQVLEEQGLSVDQDALADMAQASAQGGLDASAESDLCPECQDGTCLPEVQAIPYGREEEELASLLMAEIETRTAKAIKDAIAAQNERIIQMFELAGFGKQARKMLGC